MREGVILDDAIAASTSWFGYNRKGGSLKGSNKVLDLISFERSNVSPFFNLRINDGYKLATICDNRFFVGGAWVEIILGISRQKPCWRPLGRRGYLSRRPD
jgi:hypothetical protein